MSRPFAARRQDANRRALAYASRAFSPMSISGLALWLRADMGITLATTKIAAWADQSGNGRDFAQGTDAQRPVFVSTTPAFAGQPCARFGGVQILSSLASLPAFPSGLSVVMAIGNTPNQVSVAMEVGSGTAADSGGIYIDNPVAYRGLYQKPAATFTQHRYVTPPTASSFITTIDPTVAAASQVRTYVDNVVGVAVSNSASPGTIISAAWNLGARVGLVAPATFDLAEMLVYDHVLTATERAAITAYQQARFG